MSGRAPRAAPSRGPTGWPVLLSVVLGGVLLGGLLLVGAVGGGAGAVGGGGEVSGDGAGGGSTTTVVHLLRDADHDSIPLVGGLTEHQVVVLRADGFSANHTGGMRLCVVAEPNRCGPAFPVRFDDAGAATVQFQLDPQGDAGDCPTASRCVLELFDGLGSGFADLGFGLAEPTDMQVRLPGGPHLVVDQPFEVVVRGTLPAGPLSVVVCRRADPFPRSCSTLPGQDPVGATVVPTVTDPAATRSMVVTPTADTVGPCQDGCVLSLRAGADSVRAEVIEVRASVEPPARYRPARLAVGLTAAVLLVLLGGWLWRRTDWSPPRAADGAAIDQAEFADLDAEAERWIDAELDRPVEAAAARGHPRR